MRRAVRRRPGAGGGRRLRNVIPWPWGPPMVRGWERSVTARVEPAGRDRRAEGNDRRAGLGARPAAHLQRDHSAAARASGTWLAEVGVRSKPRYWAASSG